MGDGDDHVLAIVRDLAALGGADATEALARREAFSITVDDIAIRVAYTSGTTPTLFLSAPYAPRIAARDATGLRHAAQTPIAAGRPMSIELTRESPDERDAKARGVTREVQTGDAAFDEAVYVDSPSPDAVVAAVLASPALRRAVQVLLSNGFPKISLDDEAGNIATQRGVSLDARADAITIARAFATIAAEVPAVQGKHARQRTWPQLAVFTLLFTAPAGAITALVVGSLAATLLGTIGGAALGLGLGASFARTQYGRSDSHWRVRGLKLVGTCIGILVGALAGLLIAGADTGALAWFAVIPTVIGASIWISLALGLR